MVASLAREQSIKSKRSRIAWPRTLVTAYNEFGYYEHVSVASDIFHQESPLLNGMSSLKKVQIAKNAA